MLELLLFGVGLVMLMLDVRAEHFEQVDDALAMLGADRDRVAEAERIGFQPAILARAAFRLVRRDDDRRLPGAKPAADLLVERRQPLAPVDQEQRDVRIAHRRLGLLAHPARQRVRVLVLVAGRVDDPEFEPDQLGVALTPVARDAGAIVHQRQLLADEAVEKRRLAHIGAADDRDGGEAGH